MVIASIFDKIDIKRVLVFLFCLLPLLPFIVISYYNYYSADDYFYALSRIERGFWDAQKFSYEYMNGRYSTTFYLTSLPLALGYDGWAWVSPVFIIVLLGISIYYFCNGIIGKGSPVYTYLLLTSLILIPVFGLVNSPSESIFWASGAASYGTSVFLLFFFLGSITRFILWGRKLIHYILSIISLIILVGSNETMTIFADFTLLSVFLGVLIFQKKMDYKLVLMGVMGLLLTFFVVKSPGNVIRIKQSQELFNYTVKMDFLYNSKQLVEYAITVFEDWYSNGLMMLCNLSFLVFLLNSRDKRLVSYSHLLWLFLPLILFAFYVSFFPIFYTLGIAPPERVLIVYLVFFVITNFFIVFLIEGLLSKLSWIKKLPLTFFKFSLLLSMCLLVIGVFFSKNKIMLAYNSILEREELKKLRKEIKRKIKMVKFSNADTVLVNRDLVWNPILSRENLSIEDAGYFSNQLLAAYYKKKCVKVKPYSGQKLYDLNYTFDQESVDLTSLIKDTTVFSSRPFSSAMRGKDDYGATVKIPMSRLKDYKRLYGLKVSFKTLKTAAKQEYFAYFYVVSETDKHIFWHQKYFKTGENEPHDINTWKEVNYDIPVGLQEGLRNKNNKLVFFFQNASASPVNIDDLQLTFYE